MKFLCDQMFGTLAKWLRILGFDTFYSNEGLSDTEILDIAKKENRVLITRDKHLSYNARRENVKNIFVNEKNLDIQLKTVLKDIKIDEKQILSRCLVCNSLVESIEKEKIKEKVPEKIFENHDDFYYCRKCDKVYWIGSHFDMMKQKIKNL